MTKNKRAAGEPVWTVPALGVENTLGDQARRNEIENGNLPLVPIQTQVRQAGADNMSDRLDARILRWRAFVMMLRCFFVAYVAIGSFLSGQTISPLYGDGRTEMSLNQDSVSQRRSQASKSNDRNVVVFVGDRVIPQFVDGSGWKTTMTLVNLENHGVNFQVLFFQDNGMDLLVPVVGQGIVRGINVVLGTAASFTFETAGTGSQLAQGWALISQTTNDSVGGFAIFRQSVPGRSDQEAVVPIVNQFDNHFVLLFDNTAYVTGIAISNPTLNAVVIPVNIRNEQGVIVDQRTTALGPYAHTAFVLPSTWTSTAGKRGAIEFLTSGFGVGALGLRFNGAAFTSFHVLENLNWRLP